jgi:glycosyltransferase involved in cell wall biosynthesis
MKLKILHISHTDIRVDSRILKELEAISSIESSEVIGFGIDDGLKKKFVGGFSFNIISFRLRSKNFKFLPKSVRHLFNYLEALFLMLIPGIRLKPKIVHCHDTLFLPIGVLIKIFCGSKLIYDAHELESLKNGLTKFLSKATLFIEKISWKFVDVLVTVSPSIVDWYSEHLGSKRSILVLNSPKFKVEALNASSDNYLRDKFHIPINEKIFIYLGIICKGRGVDLYLDVFQSNDVRSHIVFIGFGDDVSKIEAASKICNKIHYHPSVPHQEVVRISKTADVGLAMIEAVSLSDYYCLPNKLFEYAFSGLYVLASDFPDMKKVVTEYELGMCCSLELEELKRAVIEIGTKELQKTKANLYPLSWQYQEEVLLSEYNHLLKA